LSSRGWAHGHVIAPVRGRGAWLCEERETESCSAGVRGVVMMVAHVAASVAAVSVCGQLGVSKGERVARREHREASVYNEWTVY
jgi:hypothetical protein